MVILLDGNSEMDLQVYSEIGNLIWFCLDQQQSQICFFFK